MESGPVPKNKENSITTVLQEVIANELKPKAGNALETIPKLVEDTVEQLF